MVSAADAFESLAIWLAYVEAQHDKPTGVFLGPMDDASILLNFRASPDLSALVTFGALRAIIRSAADAEVGRLVREKLMLTPTRLIDRVTVSLAEVASIDARHAQKPRGPQ